ncbi:twitching motility protein PilT [Gordonia spumicola]|uniref:Twitching motility protein PilT n=1 Tax=Gordonia spumicola TaxID=589161 RepID=A0A7I9V7S7_9ACTN|nr:type II toxin-antitoxin system VapC family toxin [Gordonia spumicola]GEE01425.1 twitching motility protein PilT [Gordonia spumicola]
MTALLLDTNALLWLVSDPTRVNGDALAVISDPANDLYVSAASAWEVATKARLGRLNASALLATWADTVNSMSAVDLPVDPADAILAGSLEWGHRDPFDRMIVAQAARRGLTIATSDRILVDGAPTKTLDTRR